MSKIVAARVVLPEHVYRQEEVTEVLADAVLGASPRRELMRRLHASAGVRTRHLALPLDRYRDLGGFGPANDVWIDAGGRLGEEAVSAALTAAGLAPSDVDLIVTTSVTGLAVPSLDARIAGRLGLRDDVKRMPLFGLGCVAGAAGIARIHDHLQGHPDDVAVLLSVELCSLTFQRDDTSTANLVGSALFGDGAAAVVMVGERRAAGDGRPPRVRATRSRLYPDSEQVMGWDIGGSGFRLVLAATIPDIVDTYLRDDVETFLAGHGLAVTDVGTWIAHPGGPKVIEAIDRALELKPHALDVTRHSLASVGNLSSSSVLHVLQETLAARDAGASARPAVMLAMGPGFCSELVLLDW
ncbi:type III polyketide synthase [Actinoplanes sp. NBRC 103695]|uniref:type III polyketide synthase n=1 Tax=Actinoplanes sp. NBRC 103695 TaxID=3032202 RepID=UPI0024A35B7E|nr:type III polyketide synthase [Actinoplanes sp. NBRC 103695]GLY95091.1 stilbene synthase [Actinoplanes sp. NBRC 103695]